ncbi:MAG: hypothetical protein US92_C0001G0182 [Candidatus Peregrinibacteria bacterium GW2011_GWA2_38_36]|nr:MAG: hypothetical protein US92_C0001G0182 [Candidatus Peregrinibacteria bacterium GW2011_GWA2_38_36]
MKTNTIKNTKKTINFLQSATIFFVMFLLIFPVAQAAGELKNYIEYKVGEENGTIVIRGDSSREQLGSSIAKGDLNGDMIDDIAIGSPYFSDKDRKNVGRVKMFFGKKGFDVYASNKFQADMEIRGESANNQLGASVAFGDFNGDRVDDLAIGSAGGDKVYMFLGKAEKKFPEIIDLSKDSADIIFQTAELNENFGFALDVADLNADGMLDLIIGAPSASQAGKSRSGKVYVVFGYRYPAHQFVYDFKKNPPAMIIYGEKEFDRFGASITHGDVNGDKRPDIIVGAYLSSAGVRKETGKVYMFFGQNPSDLTIYKQYPIRIFSPDVVIEGEAMRNWLGFSLYANDINADGVDDIAAGSFMYQSENKTGKAHIFYGDKNLTSQNQKFTNSMRVFGDNDEPDILGAAVYIDDLNGDSKKDFIIGAPGVKKFGKDTSGYVYVYSNQSIKNKEKINMSDKTPTLIIEGENPNDWFGSSILTADLNKDGYPDLIVGAPNAYNAGGKEGAVYIILGKSGWNGKSKYTDPLASDYVTRAQIVYQTMNNFDLERFNKDFLDNCKNNLELCFFTFTARTKFKEIKLGPEIILYPDISSSQQFYKEITEMTMLGFLDGFGDDSQSKFKPDEKITRIHALRILLNSAGMLKWKEYAELKKELGGENAVYGQTTPYKDVSGRTYYAWWYPRYVNFAYIAEVIKSENYFRPNDPIKQSELREWFAAIKKFSEGK